METEFKKLTEDEYRDFETWIRENGKELYENKIQITKSKVSLVSIFDAVPSSFYTILY